MFKRGIYHSKKGQVTLFIIIAVIVVALAALVYIFYPQLQSAVGISTDNPQTFLQTCINDKYDEAINSVTLRGGDISPSNYVLYGGVQISYLCYTNEYYTPCVMQQPFLKSHIEDELKSNIGPEISSCFDLMKDSFENKGYTFNLQKGAISVEILPERIVTNIDYTLTLSKEDTNVYNSFRIIRNNNLYELLGITNSILNWETRYGDAETTTYMDYYHNLKVEKKKQEDGSTIYILTDRNDGSTFQFASRSYAYPPGYGINA